LGTLGGTFAVAAALNASGQVVGQADTADQKSHAALWTVAPDGRFTVADLGTLGGDFSFAGAINASGQIVGSAQNADGDLRATLFTPGAGGNVTRTDLGTLGGFASSAKGINSAGLIVGEAETEAGDTRGFFRDAAGRMSDLSRFFFGSFLEAISADAINDLGQIAVTRHVGTGPDHAFLYPPRADVLSASQVRATPRPVTR